MGTRPGAVTTTDHIPADGAVSTNRPSLSALTAAAGSGAARPASTARRQAWLLCKGRSKIYGGRSSEDQPGNLERGGTGRSEEAGSEGGGEQGAGVHKISLTS